MRSRNLARYLGNVDLSFCYKCSSASTLDRACEARNKCDGLSKRNGQINILFGLKHMLLQNQNACLFYDSCEEQEQYRQLLARRSMNADGEHDASSIGGSSGFSLVYLRRDRPYLEALNYCRRQFLQPQAFNSPEHSENRVLPT